MDDMKIVEAWWLGPERTQLMTVSENYGRVLVAEGTEIWESLLSNYTMDDLDKMSEEKAAKEEEQKEIRRQQENDQMESERQKILFERKLEAFEIPEVKSSKNKQLRARIRKSKSEMEVVAFVSLIIAEELAKENGGE